MQQSQDYNFFSTDQPYNSEKDDDCIYYRNSLPFKMLDINYLQRSTSFKVRLRGKICSFTYLYRSLSYSKYIFEISLDNLELSANEVTANNPYIEDPSWTSFKIKNLIKKEL